MTVKQAFYFLEGVKQYCHWKMLQAVIIWQPKDFEMVNGVVERVKKECRKLENHLSKI